MQRLGIVHHNRWISADGQHLRFYKYRQTEQEVVAVTEPPIGGVTPTYHYRNICESDIDHRRLVDEGRKIKDEVHCSSLVIRPSSLVDERQPQSTKRYFINVQIAFGPSRQVIFLPSLYSRP